MLMSLRRVECHLSARHRGSTSHKHKSGDTHVSDIRRLFGGKQIFVAICNVGEARRQTSMHHLEGTVHICTSIQH